MTDKLICTEIKTACGRVIGHITLNKPNALNALDLDMAVAMQAALDKWRTDEQVLFVVLSGSGNKAFCAGGDIVSMYRAMQENKGAVPDFVEAFFTTEYRLDYTIHRYPKPVLVWGDGIIMGGGTGLLAGASHRILTTSTRLAMPEITIGLYPDVGASYFLPRAPGFSGLFLGLTGAAVNATDGVYIGLGDYVFESASIDSVISELASLNWQPVTVTEQLSSYCETQQLNSMQRPMGKLATHRSLIDSQLIRCKDAAQAVHAIAALSAEDDWLQSAQRNLAKGSPITMHLVWEQYQRGAELTLEQCFAMELTMSCRCAESGEFAEGVRALLIDKDNQPAWRYKAVSDVPDAVVARHFDSLWQSHPLANLGEVS
ncbi:enoyl-CoA hydratase/isomerase family protein [Alteromonas gilva]|uniref:3-hydroxyisobutyryl-CoA hydrolase n=1 Tax=Alteromonas gilva TaxID=2987522 RepID=A0ABT5L1P9_9ALTE|nr:enoyl-CoA hydratase/isomerase family protein [Alteromonas gilva]MDC8830974.1 enoyl-CoA hydratase/isomerase family protein [Alteromonas gilva]